MANFFNSLGSSVVTGTALQDQFFAFTGSTNLDDALPDLVASPFSWTTAIRTETGFYEFNAVSIQVSTDLLLGGDKSDFLFGSNLNDAVLYNNGALGSGVGGFDSIEQFVLGAGDDFIDLTGHGPGGVDYVKDVIIQGGAGNDVVIGGAGKDTINGDAGDDVIFGYRGGDVIDGGAGNDTLYGDDLGYNGIAGDDILRGGSGNDTLYGGARTDRLEGGDNNDLLYGGLGGDNLLGGAGDDMLFGDDDGAAPGNDKLDGESGNDSLFGGGGNDELNGGSGNDVLEGGDGDDFLSGGTESDLLTGGAGADTVQGGAGSDIAVFSGNRADYSVTPNPDGSFTIVDLRSGSPDGTDTVATVEIFRFADGEVPAAELNTSPTIVSDGGGDTATFSMPENATAVTTVAATDPDVGQTLTYSIVGGADASKFLIDPVTGVLSFAVAPNFEAPDDADFDNIYDVVVQASDGVGGVDTQALSVAVNDVNEGTGSAPVITSNGGGATASVTVGENTAAVTTVTATDADGTTPTYLISGGADAAFFSIDPTSGALTFLSAPDFELPADADHNGVYEVIVRATDGTNTDSQILSVTVTNANDNAPVIGSNGGGSSVAISVAENITAVTTVSATDADGTTPTYAIVGGADATLFEINPTTGALVFLSAPDFEVPADADQNGIYEVIVQASDDLNTDTQALSITVTNANDNPPVISSNGGGGTASISIAENTAAVTTVVASDADGTIPTYAIAGGADAALFGIDSSTGALVFLASPDFEHPLDADGDNVYEVMVQASDGVNMALQTLSVTVTDINENGKTITGTSGNNTITPTTTVVAFQTTVLNDTIFGLAGNDTIDGGAGADRMEGGTGNDIYTVDTFSDDGFAGNDDQVIELAGTGTDLVNAGVNYRLPAEVENLTLIGAAAINGVGNLLANTINGNAAANVLSGEAGIDVLNGNTGSDTLNGGDGNDTLSGGADNDLLFGDAGNDKLDGGLGADRMEGGAGNDTYTVDTYSDDGVATNDDQIIELAGGGTDIVNASVSYTLAAEVENLTLTGSAAIDGTGNALANNISGNSAGNVLRGLVGNDTLSGNAGSDTLYGGDGNDTLSGGADNDSLYGEAGIDNLQGGAGDDVLDGGVGADTLTGQAGNDRLIGGVNKDTLTGGTEADTFVFNFGDTTLNSSSYDTVKDFQTGLDRIDLDFVSGGLAASVYAETSVAANSFATALAAANALTGPGIAAIFVAGTTDGWLFWDSNGDTSLDQSVLMTGVNSEAAFGPLDIV
jgi:Ca2+-binding RTX toxin-like protein